TMYEVEVASGTKVNKVLQLASDIAYALATPDVRIQAPIPGKSAIGIEVPNKHRDFVMLGDILRSKAAKEATHPLEVALGKDIDGYEEGLRAGTLRAPLGLEHRFGHLPFIVVVIDELADLMMVAPRDVEDAICRIAQMARAVGIHLVVATQRPSVDVVTGLIKANIPARIAFMTASQADSRVILDVGGAEKLVGHGDMLFQPANVSKAIRIQGAWVTEKEIDTVTEWVRRQREPEYEASVEGMGRPPAESDEALDGDDELLEQAAELVIRSQLGSTSMLQRKLKVGFARAGRIMDLLEERGI